MEDVNDNLEALSDNTDFAKAVSENCRIHSRLHGVLHYARDIPYRNLGESDLDRIQIEIHPSEKLFERSEKDAPYQLLHRYFAKLGMPVTGRKVSDNGIRRSIWMFTSRKKLSRKKCTERASPSHSSCLGPEQKVNFSSEEVIHKGSDYGTFHALDASASDSADGAVRKRGRMGYLSGITPFHDSRHIQSVSAPRNR